MKDRAFCSKEHAYLGLKKANPSVRRAVWAPDHPLAGSTGYVREQRMVLYDRIGPGPHPCHWCAKEVNWTVGVKTAGGSFKGMLVADHLNANEFDNRPENLVPACQGCNFTRTLKIAPDEIHVVRKNGQKRRAIRHVCEVCGSSFDRAPTSRRPFRFCSRACFYASRRKT